MSQDLLKSINHIKTSVNENDQVLWECQAAEKCSNEAIEKLKEECDRLNQEITKIDKEALQIEPQIKTLAANYDVQIESVFLNQQSLINQRLYKGCLKEKMKKHQEEMDKVLCEYTEYIQHLKKNLELTNSTYKILQSKKIELKQSKIRCMDLQQRIIELKDDNKQNSQIKRKLFYADIIEFAQNWVNKKGYLEVIKRLEDDSKKEKEYLNKLAEVAEKLKQKQMEKFLQKHTNNYSLPKIEFSANEIPKNGLEVIPEKGKTQEHCFANFKKLLEKNDADMTSNLKKKELQKLTFNTSHSKVRILENRTLKASQEVEKTFIHKSKEAKTKEITAKIQKVVQNLNKTISRQNSKRITTSQKSQPENEKLSQQSNTNHQECRRIDVNLNPQMNPYEKTRTAQIVQNSNLANKNIRKPNTNFVNPGFNKSQFFNRQNYYINAEHGTSMCNTDQRFSNEHSRNNKCSQDLTGRLPNMKTIIEPAESTSLAVENSQINMNSNSKMQNCNPGEKPPFNMYTPADNLSYPPFLVTADQATTKNDNMSQYNNISLEMPATPYKADMTDDYDEVVFKSPCNLNYSGHHEENDMGSMGINFSGVPNFTGQALTNFGGQPIFSFGEILK